VALLIAVYSTVTIRYALSVMSTISELLIIGLIRHLVLVSSRFLRIFAFTLLLIDIDKNWWSN